MSLELSDAAKDLLAQKGFDPLLGARPLRRVIQRDIEDAISEKILLGELGDNEHVLVDAEGEGILGEFTFTGKPFEQDADGNKPELVGASTGASNGADATDDGADDAGADTADTAE
jgi:ATP-dependent Clp protease ATP-binding subunit ClpC